MLSLMKPPRKKKNLGVRVVLYLGGQNHLFVDMYDDFFLLRGYHRNKSVICTHLSGLNEIISFTINTRWHIQ